MNDAILHTDVQKFINTNLNIDIPTLLFQKSSFEDVSSKELAEQIEAKYKCKNKLPTWFSTENIYYPNKLNISQTSSEMAAGYKARMVTGSSLADITAGLGVDSYSFSKKIERVYHVEKDENLSKIADHNFKQIGVSNINFVSSDGIDFIRETKEKFDWIFVDPSRRTNTNKKVFYLTECEPDVTKHLDLLFTKTQNILIKTGPLLDLNAGLKQLKHIKEIHIVSIENEVKEVLWILKEGFTKEPIIKSVNMRSDSEDRFDFHLSEERLAAPKISQPQNYLYEPNAALLKSGAFKLISSRLSVYKLHTHSHLYTSETLRDFPGRRFEIKEVLNYNKKEVKRIGLTKANITTRNFPDSVAVIRKKLKIKEGGTDYLFFTKNMEDKPIIIHCLK
jgi:16S rRNA G966 N2-methylase RsmD